MYGHEKSPFSCSEKTAFPDEQYVILGFTYTILVNKLNRTLRTFAFAEQKSIITTIYGKYFRSLSDNIILISTKTKVQQNRQQCDRKDGKTGPNESGLKLRIGVHFLSNYVLFC